MAQLVTAEKAKKIPMLSGRLAIFKSSAECK